VFTLKSANEIWLKLHQLHDGTSNVHEKKHCLAKQSYNSFKMNENELVCDMYSHLNLIINKLNFVGLAKLGDADIVRKIISVLPHHKYASIITILHNMVYLGNISLAIVIGKLVAMQAYICHCTWVHHTSMYIQI